MNPEDRYTADVASGTYTTNDAYSEDAYELHTDSLSSGSGQQLPQHAGLERDIRPPQQPDDRRVLHLRRTNAGYRPPTANNSTFPRSLGEDSGGGEPPLLEIPEEIYAVRKSALQVMKPLIGSWVRALKPLFL